MIRPRDLQFSCELHPTVISHVLRVPKFDLTSIINQRCPEIDLKTEAYKTVIKRGGSTPRRVDGNSLGYHYPINAL